MIKIKDDNIYDVKQIAKTLNISIFTVRHWIRSRQLQAKKTGRKYYVAGVELKKTLLNKE